MKPSSCCSSFGQVAAALILRLWVGSRLLLAGMDKWRSGSGIDAHFLPENYDPNVQKFMKTMLDESFLSAYVVPQKSMLFFSPYLGHALVVVGVLVIIGLFRSLSLLAAGGILLMLGIGLATLPDDNAMVMIGIQIAITAFALTLAKHDWISVDGFFRLLFRGGKKQKLEISND